MSNAELFSSILKVPGVDQFILVDGNAKIVTQAITEPRKMAALVYSCGSNSYEIGKKKFRYLVFSRENHDDFFIFPVGKYYLGVIKQHNMNNALLAENVIQFLKDFLNRK